MIRSGDVVVLWYKCKRDLSKLDPETNEFVAPLIEAFDKRTETLMQNPLLATAVYVDPRLNHKKRSSEFLGDMKDVAEVHLFFLFGSLRKLLFDETYIRF